MQFARSQDQCQGCDRSASSMSRIVAIGLIIGIFWCLLVNGSKAFSWPSLWSKVETRSEQLIQEQADIFARVLNFFPEPVAEECLSGDKRRRGICMNTYECKEKRGSLHGPCALGFGACCIFTAGCGGEIQNNVTYISSPGFPNLIDQAMNCSILVKKIDPQVSQLRIDFLHFNIGQPNRRTGVCDDDVLVVRSGERSYQLCGWNSGQHLYVDIGEEPVTINFRLPGNLTSRMWEMSVTQLGFEQRAPAGCLQYMRSVNGTIRSLNYLPKNGRYLANYDYLVCIRQEWGMCSIAYTPCGPDTFNIGKPRTRRPSAVNETVRPQGDDAEEGSGSGGTSVLVMKAGSGARCKDRVLIPCDFEEFITPGNDGAGICDLEHCGSSLCHRDDDESDEERPVTKASKTRRRSKPSSKRNKQKHKTKTRTKTKQRIASAAAAAVAHTIESSCRVESSALPFHIRLEFGPGEDTGTPPQDNAGMCLNYEQLPCSA